MYKKSRRSKFAVAARCLNLFSAMVMILTGIYVEATFGHVFSTVWKLVIAGAVLGHTALHAQWMMSR